MSSLPTECPRWYQVDEELKTPKGWTPKTSDITEIKKNHDITNAWNGTYYPDTSRNFTVNINRLKILSPIQVGGGSFPEGGILPAQIGGVPIVPGSSIRGVFLSYLKGIWQTFSSEEESFWSSLINSEKTGWQPQKIRFASILLKNLKAFPLNPQQNWQVFDEANNKLGIQWQVSPHDQGIGHPAASQFSLQVTLKTPPSQTQKQWLQKRLETMLKEQGIGRGTRSGFGRLGASIPPGKWEIKLTGMKPCVQQLNNNENIHGKYRWSPQVLRAHLRSYFTRLALVHLKRSDAEALTETIFGGFGRVAKLTLTSYLVNIQHGLASNGYANIQAQVAHATWNIQVSCTDEFFTLVGRLLELSSRLGGLGPGWRRPPHRLERFNGFRGSQFTVNTDYQGESIADLMKNLQQEIKKQAQRFNFQVINQVKPQKGMIISIFRGKPEQWEEIVHGVCSTNAPNRPNWCGKSNTRPSGYGVRQHSDHCLITVFDPQVEATLQAEGFQVFWRC